MENRARWIAVRADMLDHEILQGDPYSRRCAWLWLIANAAWKEHRVRTRGGMIVLRRGEVVAGLEYLAETWGWSVKKVRTFLRDLEVAGMIEKRQAKTQYATVYSLTKYETYQTRPAAHDGAGASEGQAKGTRGASEGQHSTRDTKDTKDTTPLPPSGGMAADDIRTFISRLEDLAGDALANPANSAGLLNYSPVIAWLDCGADREKDIVPAIMGVASQALKGGKKGSIRSWEYFSQAVSDNVARRKKGLPAAQAIAKRDAYAGLTADQRARQRAALEAAGLLEAGHA